MYGKGKHAVSARSINVEDINKITGYDPEHTGVNINKATDEEIAAGTKYEAGKLWQYGNKVTYEWDETDTPKYTSSVANGKLTETHNWNRFKGFSWWNGSSFQKSDYTATPGKICTLTSDYYYYYPETLTTTNDETKSVGLVNLSVEDEMLFEPTKDTTKEYYWLASRCVGAGEDYASFYLRSVYKGYVGYGYLALSDGYENLQGIGLRPVVSLEPDIQLKKDDSGVWQFAANE